MPINYPADRNELATRMKTDVQNSLLGSNPFLRNSWLAALIVAIAGRIYDVYYQLKNNLVPNLFPWSAELTFLQNWGGWVGITVKPATQSTGYIAVTGTVGTLISAGSELQTTDGAAVLTDSDGTIAAVSAAVASITRVGTLATVTTSAAHSFATGQTVVMAGADQSEYNGSFEVTVIDSTSFSYTVSGSPTTPATGTITASADMVSLAVTSSDYGASSAIEAGSALTFSTPITGADSTAYVGVDGVSGGEDEEDTETYRARVQERYQNPVTLFNDAAIIAAAKSVSGVTRVWVQDCTPDTGEVTVYFVCDGQSPISPTSAQVTAVTAAIMAIAPANVDNTYVHVDGPTLDSVDFTFSALDPATSTMKTAIEASLAQAFTENAEVGVNFSQYAYSSAIFNTVDLSTGAAITSFALSAPSGDVTVAAGHLPVLGTVTYP